jgi:hypothetical protein
LLAAIHASGLAAAGRRVDGVATLLLPSLEDRPQASSALVEKPSAKP